MYNRKEKLTRNDCEAMIKVMQENQHTIMAIAESVHDEIACDATIMKLYDDAENMEHLIEEIPTMLTVSLDIDDNDTVDMEWQSGDNNYSGACYSHRFWAVVYFDPTATPESYYEQLIEDMDNNLPW